MGTTAGQQPPAGGTDANRSTADPAAAGQQGKAGGGGPGDGGAGKPSAEGVAGSEFNREELDPALRGMGPKQINELFLGLLQQAGRNGGRSEEPVKTAEPAKPPEPINYKEMLDPNHENFAPDKAFKSFVEQNYGGLLGDINRRSMQGVMGRLRGEFHDFNEYEADIEKALSGKDPTTLTDNDVLGTYVTLKGARLIAKERADRASTSGSSTHKPSPPSPEKPEPVVLSEDQKKVAGVMFAHTADPEGEYAKWKEKADKGPHQLSVPIDATGKRA